MPKTKIALLFIYFFIQACGVKTDPVPPIKPADIGTGKPLYKVQDDTEDSKTYKKTNMKKENEEE